MGPKQLENGGSMRVNQILLTSNFTNLMGRGEIEYQNCGKMLYPTKTNIDLLNHLIKWSLSTTNDCFLLLVDMQGLGPSGEECTIMCDCSLAVLLGIAPKTSKHVLGARIQTA
jgi:hypothetical protein